MEERTVVVLQCGPWTPAWLRQTGAAALHRPAPSTTPLHHMCGSHWCTRCSAHARQCPPFLGGRSGYSLLLKPDPQDGFSVLKPEQQSEAPVSQLLSDSRGRPGPPSTVAEEMITLGREATGECGWRVTGVLDSESKGRSL
ncbi:unnamed protein product [Arctogadus glacialis]